MKDTNAILYSTSTEITLIKPCSQLYKYICVCVCVVAYKTSISAHRSSYTCMPCKKTVHLAMYWMSTVQLESSSKIDHVTI